MKSRKAVYEKDDLLSVTVSKLRQVIRYNNIVRSGYVITTLSGVAPFWTQWSLVATGLPGNTQGQSTMGNPKK